MVDYHEKYAVHLYLKKYIYIYIYIYKKKLVENASGSAT